MKRLFFPVLLFCTVLGTLSGREEADVFASENFLETLPRYRKEPGTRVSCLENGSGVRIEHGLLTRRIRVPEGETLRFSARMKLENVRRKQNGHWRGTRFAVRIGKDSRSGAPVRDGSSDWETVSFKVDIPLDIHDLELQIGLKDAEGCVILKDLKIEIIK